MRKHQQHIEDVLSSRNVNFEKVDIADPNNDEQKQFMRENAKPSTNSKTPLPPQLFADDEYLGVSTCNTNSLNLTLHYNNSNDCDLLHRLHDKSILMNLKTFLAVFCAQPIAQVFGSLKPQGLRIQIKHEALLCPIFKIQLNSC